MANYNIAITVDTSGAISSLSALNSQLKATNDNVNKLKSSSDDAGKSMSDSFGDVAQQLQNFDQGIQNLVTKFLELKGVTDDYINNSIKKLTDLEDKQVQMKVVLNTTGVNESIEGFKKNIQKATPEMTARLMGYVQTGDTKNIKGFAESISSSKNTTESLLQQIKTIQESSNTVTEKNNQYTKMITDSLTNQHQDNLHNQDLLRTEIARLYKSGLYDEKQVTEMFTNMASFGLTAKELTDKIVKNQDGTTVSVLDKIIQLAETYNAELGGGSEALNKAAKMVFQTVYTASTGDKNKDTFRELAVDLGKHLDMMLNSFVQTPLNINSVADVLERSVGKPLSLYTGTTFDDLLAIAGKLVQSMSGAEAGVYIQATHRDLIMVANSLAKISDEQRDLLVKFTQGGKEKQKAVAASPQVLAKQNLIDQKLFEMGEKVNAMFMSFSTEEKQKLAGLEGKDYLDALTKLMKSKGIDKEMPASLSGFIQGGMAEYESLLKGQVTLSEDLLKRYVEGATANELTAIRDAQNKLVGFKLNQDVQKLDDSGKLVTSYQKEREFRLGELAPKLMMSVEGKLLRYKTEGQDGTSQMLGLMHNQQGEMAAAQTLYTLYGNDMVTTVTALVKTGKDIETLKNAIQNTSDNLKRANDEQKKTLGYVMSVQEGLDTGVETALAQSFGGFEKQMILVTNQMKDSFLTANTSAGGAGANTLGNTAMFLSALGKGAGIIALLLSLSASFQLILPYLTEGATGMAIVPKLLDRIKGMLPVFGYLAVGLVVVLAISKAIDKLSSIMNSKDEKGFLYNLQTYYIPALIEGKKEFGKLNKDMGVGIQAGVDLALAFRNIFLGLFDGFADGLMLGIAVIYGTVFAISQLVKWVLYITNYIGGFSDETNNLSYYLGVALGLFASGFVIMKLFAGVMALVSLFSSPVLLVILAIAGGFALFNKFGMIGVGVIFALSIAVGMLTAVSSPVIAGIALIIAGISGVVLIAYAAIHALLFLGKTAAGVVGYFNKDMGKGLEDAVNRMESKVEGFKSQVTATVGSVTDKMTPSAINPSATNPAITPEVVTGTNMPKLPDMSNFKDMQMPQLPQQQAVTVPITVHLHEAIVDTNTPAFMRKVSDNLIPYIERALNERNVNA